MNIPVILDVALGLVLIYFVLSLLASEIQDIIGTLLQWRAEHLKLSIEVLLSGNDQQRDAVAQELADALYQSPWIRGLNQEAKGRIARSFRGICHALGSIYRTLTGGRNVFGDGQTSGPSYIPSEAFANSLLERMQLGQLWQVIADDRLRTLADQKLLRPVSDVLNDLKASTSNEFLLNAELQQLEQSTADILTDFETGQTTLDEALARLVDRLDSFTVRAQDVLPDNHPLSETFLRRLAYIRQDLVSSDMERSALIKKLRPTMEQLLDTFEPGSASYQELQALAQRGSGPAQQLLAQVASNNVPSALRSNLLSIARKAELSADAARDQVKLFGSELEKWFDRGMDRATGVYRRNAKAVALVIGIATAISVNADSFHIATRLVKDPALRNSVTASAEQIATQTQDGTLEENLEEVQTAVDNALQDIPFPLGYNETVLAQQQDAEDDWPIPVVQRRYLGWLVSGVAISMGSTFWFNLLRQIVSVRKTDDKPK